MNAALGVWLGLALSRVGRDSRELRDASARAAGLVIEETERVGLAACLLRGVRQEAARRTNREGLAP
jgi:hypothetical protein